MFALNRDAVVGLVLALAMGCGGCGGRSAGTTTPRDGAVDDGAIPVDGARPSDAARPLDGGPCVREELWTADLRPIVLIEANDFDTPREGQSFRVRVTAEPLSPCQMPGPTFFDSSEHQGRIIVSLRAVVWTLNGADQCPPPAEDRPWIVTVPGDQIRGHTLRLVAFGNQTIEFELPVEPCPPAEDCFCAQPVSDPAGHLEPCTYDCQCEEGSCLPDSGWDPGSRGCMRPCNDIEACREGEVCTSYLDGPSMLCESGPGVACLGDQDCPFGYRCVTVNQESYCALSVVEPDPGFCCDDTDCGYGVRCTDLAPNQARCMIPCSTHEKCRAVHPELICYRTGYCIVPLDG